jgi:branched-chain amino acid transport system ATP-binding protein
LLEVEALSAWPGPVEAVRGASLTAPAGVVTAVVGPNGAGKTTFARAVAGLHGERSGRIAVGGRDVSQAEAVEIARTGLALVPQGRRLFASLTVAEHIALARRHRRPGALDPAVLLEFFPNLTRRTNVRARSLSGGEQQMLAITRAVLAGPDVLVLDEPTEGLAPSIVELVGRLVTHLRDEGVAILLFEQHGAFPAAVADRTLTIARGTINAPRPTEVTA